MKFALVGNQKLEAAQGYTGLCPSCGSKVVAKCGAVKINHWAHKGTRSCDPWWENETEWHRSWKNHFPVEWQETILNDALTNEKHIADVRTSHGLVIEFQHSYIDPAERTKREHFYKNMVWVVDGTRLTRDYPRFLKGKVDFRPTKMQGVFSTYFPEECFPAAWLGSSVPVIFDFGEVETINDDTKIPLYFLYTQSGIGESFVARISKESLVKDIIAGNFLQQKEKPTKQVDNTLPKITPNILQRSSQYVFHRGRYVRRRRL